MFFYLIYRRFLLTYGELTEMVLIRSPLMDLTRLQILPVHSTYHAAKDVTR